MKDIKNKIQKVNKTHLQIAGVLLLVLLAVFLFCFSKSTSMQSVAPMMADVYFDGEYRVDGGPWQKIVEGEHIPATKGDVTLRGNFHMLAPDGEYVGIYRGEIPIAFYMNHISLTFYVGEEEPIALDIENPLCGVLWVGYPFEGDPDQTVEILIHNPHSYGNETAIDEMLSNMALYSGIDFEKSILTSGETQRDIGLLFVIVSLMLFVIALFSALIHVKNTKIIWEIGLVVLFAGSYFAYSSNGASFWKENSIESNTTILGASMMLYMMFLLMSMVYFLVKTKFIGNITVISLGVTNAIFFIIPIITDVLFYDTWIWWIAVQSIANVAVAYCLIKEFVSTKRRERWLYIGALLPLVAFSVDVVGVWIGTWKGGVASSTVFIGLFAIAIITVLRLIPRNINAATKAKELELEKITLNSQLAESRISTMMSQIRPHFIYNTLGSIEQLCKIDPPKAGDLVHNFAKYLRGNFGELDNPKPILMSQEMEHVRHYISIENVRFPDMTFTFEMNSVDFHIPALTVQPIVENAIKHGLMKLPKGGTINVVSYETDTDYCISVVDDGVGFDTGAVLDDKQHVGLRNIRERLKVMVNGTLEIESTIGEGTKVLITIPKEVQV